MNIRRLVRTLVPTASLVLFLGATAYSVTGLHAQETGTLKKIREQGKINIGHRETSIPFSYYDDNQKPIGYSIDLCMKIVDALKVHLKMPNLQVGLTPVTSSTRMPLIANGTVDLECGSTSNNLERQKQISYLHTMFVTATRLVSKKSSNIKSLNDLKGKTITSTSGTTNIKSMTELNGERNLGMTITAAKDHAEAFLNVETDRAVAFAMDDVLLYGFVANSKNPQDYVVSSEAYSIEPYAFIVRKDDPAFKKVADDALAAIYKSGQINAIYGKWFSSPIPPKGINLNIPQSEVLKKVFANPTDSGDPSAYK